MFLRRPRLLLVGSWLASGCVGTQNFDDGESELERKEEAPHTSPESDAGQRPSHTASPPSTPNGNDLPASTSLPQEPNGTAEPAPAEDAGPTPRSPAPESPATSAPTTPDAGGVVEDGGGGPEVIGAGGATGADAASACEVDACNDHGACIERERWALCDCDVAALPVCELPLFREIGPSRSNDELLLVAISADGRTLVGSHLPQAGPNRKVGVKWTLDGGLEILAQNPAGPTVANRVNRDGRLIAGVVEPVGGGMPFDVIWRDGVLSVATEADAFTIPPAPRPTVEEVAATIEAAGIDVGYWQIWNVNAASEDGKVVFGLGVLPTHGARWLLRLP